jgi:hypothetical protein
MTTTAVIAALQALGTSRVAVATRGAGQGGRS